MEVLLRFLRLLGYPEGEPKLNVESLKAAVNLGCFSPVFTTIVSWLSQELQALCGSESCIHATENIDDANSFIVELKTFVKEIDCPFESFDDKEPSSYTEYEWTLLLEYLISAVMSNRMYKTDHPDVVKEMKVAESGVAKDLREMLQKLHLSKPPDDLKPFQLFTKLDSKLNEFSGKNSGILLPPAFSGTLTGEQWESIMQIQESFQEEYRRRRQLMIQRLDLTKESFHWGETGKRLSEKIVEVYENKTSAITSEPSVDAADLLSAREDVFLIEKTSGETSRSNTKSSINNVVIGPVPDRGGRPEDQMPPPPEIPSWQKSETGARPKMADTSGYSSAGGPSSSGSYSFDTSEASSVCERSGRGQTRSRRPGGQHIPGRVDQNQYLMGYSPRPLSGERNVYTLSQQPGRDAPPRVPFHFQQPQPRFAYMPPNFHAGIRGFAPPPPLVDAVRGRRRIGRFRGNQGFRGNRGGRGNRGARAG